MLQWEEARPVHRNRAHLIRDDVSDIGGQSGEDITQEEHLRWSVLFKLLGARLYDLVKHQVVALCKSIARQVLLTLLIDAWRVRGMGRVGEIRDTLGT